jgi:glycosyltransferase involved in cell wall biosynthesis
MPTVSVVIPTYNGARHLRAAIDSVLDQHGVEVEIVVVDDRSKDESHAIAADHGDPRVRAVRNDANLGPEGNWNRALGLATGRYIKLMPQDDTLLPGSLAKQVAVLDGDVDEAIALVFGARDIIGDRGQKLMSRGLKGAKTGRIAAAALVRACVRGGTNKIGEPGAVLFRKSLSDRIGGFNGIQGYVIDLDYWVRLLQHGDACYLDEPVSTFRVSAGSWSVAIGGDQAKQYRDFLDRMRAAGLIAPSGFDMALGRVTASINNIARLLFYRLAVR